MLNILRSEFYKLKHTWILWLHFILPVLYALLFYRASQITTLKNYSDMELIQTYLLILGIVLPIIFAGVTYKVVDMEENAGQFQLLLSTTKSRTKAYMGKLLVLLLAFVFSLSSAILIFAILFEHQSIMTWFIELLLMICGALASYMIHLWISMKLSGGVSIALGFIETLIALLSLTGLGDGIWYFLPCAWPSRLPVMYIVGSMLSDHSYLHRELSLWISLALPMTLVILLGSLLWFNRWDGKSLSE